MGLDDRLRAAHSRRLAETTEYLADIDFDGAPSSIDSPIAEPRRSAWMLSVAAVLAVLAGGSLMLTTPWQNGADTDANLGEVESAEEGEASGGIETTVCPSGRRAPLESAALAYVGTNQGWGRLDDLTDEQDGPYFFSGWEPGFPDEVTVEVSLAEATSAQDIRVAQDPYGDVAGTIVIGIDGDQLEIDLAGRGGWQAHDFGQPRMISAFTITRADRASNVMEVMVCLPAADDPGVTTTTTATTVVPPTTATTAPGETTTTSDATTSTTVPVGDDPHPETPDVRDSFGEVAAPDRSTMAWRAVDAYYQQTRAGQCSKELHDSYWVEGADGRIYPTWHPVDHPSGCSFMHSHGDDPRGSPLYGPSVGLPFGMAAEAQDPSEPVRRNEDHVGHKVIRQDQWRAVEGNPVNNGQQLRRTEITCDWLSKIHQGTYSPDALGNNIHEYFLNLSCSDGTEIRVKEMAFWGEPGKIFNECSGLNQARFGFTHGWIDTGVAASPHRDAPYFHDGKREFQCVPDVFYRGDGELSELWKPDGHIATPDNGSAIFSPYYIVTNPARVVDPNWRQHGLANAWVATIDFCFDDTDAWARYVEPSWDFEGMEGFRGQAPTFCRDVPASLSSVAPEDRWLHPDSPFDGSQTAIHPKSVQIFNGSRPSNHPDGALFCTDAFGQNPAPPSADGHCGPNQLVQLLATIDNRWGDRNINGSEVNAEPGLIAPGISNEWVRDFGSSVNVPN